MTPANTPAHEPAAESTPVERVATVRPVSETDASERVRAIFAEIKAVKQIDFVPRFWQVLATSPDLLEATWQRLRAVMNPESLGKTSALEPAMREAIALAVSATNGCRYCVQSHTAAFQKLGGTSEALGEVMAIVALFNSTNALADGYQIEPDVFPRIPGL